MCTNMMVLDYVLINLTLTKLRCENSCRFSACISNYKLEV